MDVLNDASDWLHSRGIDQWPKRFPRHDMAQRIERAEVLVALVNEQIVGTVTVDTYGDPEFWPDADAIDAGYIHRLAVCRKWSGRHLGAALLQGAIARLVSQGKSAARLDANKYNAPLRIYCERVGFEYLDTVDLAHRKSGARFEMKLRSKRSDRSH